MDAENQRRVVREGYDAVSFAYRSDDGTAHRAEHTTTPYDDWIAQLIRLLDDDSTILDLGCGCGVPVARQLAPNHRLTGVDASPVQIDRARQLVPTATFVCEDMAKVEFAAGCFDAIVSFYALIHLPLDDQPVMLQNVSRWLRPSGHFLATVGHTAWTGSQDDWLGVEGARMCWSHADSDTYRKWITEAGMQVVSERFVPEGDGGHTFFHATKAG